MNFTNVTPTLLTAEMSLAEKGISSAKVILTGFVVVFAVLLLLILIIKVYSGIVQKAQQGVKLKKEKVKEEKEVTAVSAPVVSAPVTATDDEAVPEEVVAVISAAVASMYGSSSKVRIKSIKKSGNGRSAWANAGVLENTRPF
ncbi:MAG: OadG family transporter subunit [Ruminococcus sp.]|nr:OadG family transporter subunit [Ruminococcus sp.]